MTDEQHIALGHIRVVSNDKMCFWVNASDYEPLSVGCHDPFCFSDPLPCESVSLSQWQDFRSTVFDEMIRNS